MGEEPASTQDLVRWAEALAGIAKTGLAFTDSLYERERFEEILNVAGDIRAVAASALARDGQASLFMVLQAALAAKSVLLRPRSSPDHSRRVPVSISAL